MSYYTTTDKTLLEKDSKYWLNTLTHLFDLYKTITVTDEESSALRGYHATRLASVAYALAIHMSAAAEAMLGTDKETPDMKASLDAAEKLFRGADRWIHKLQDQAQKQEN